MGPIVDSEIGVGYYEFIGNSISTIIERGMNMRLRNVRGSRETIASNEYVIKNEAEYKGKWNQVFGNENPIHTEIGMGKGQFITTLAQQNPDINYVGIEKYSSVLIRAIEKQEELQLPNLFFIERSIRYI